jgi:hypothetical protein
MQAAIEGTELNRSSHISANFRRLIPSACFVNSVQLTICDLIYRFAAGYEQNNYGVPMCMLSKGMCSGERAVRHHMQRYMSRCSGYTKYDSEIVESSLNQLMLSKRYWNVMPCLAQRF